MLLFILEISAFSFDQIIKRAELTISLIYTFFTILPFYINIFLFFVIFFVISCICGAGRLE